MRLKNIEFCVLIILIIPALIYTLSCSNSSDLRSNNNDLAEPLTLTMCDVGKSPQKYDGRIIRLKTRMHFGLEGTWLKDETCSNQDCAAIVSYDNEASAAKITKIRNGKKQKNLLPLFLEVEGKFKNEIYKDCCLIVRFQFNLINVKDASETNVNR